MIEMPLTGSAGSGPQLRSEAPVAPDPAVTAEQLARVAEIRRRRAMTNPRTNAQQLVRPPMTALISTEPPAAAGHVDGDRIGRTVEVDRGLTSRFARRTRRRRRHPAGGGRIAAAGLGATVMLGIVTAFGLDSVRSAASTPTPPPESVDAVLASPVQVVIHRIPPQAANGPVIQAPVAPGVAVADIPTAVVPIELTATPIIKTVTVAVPSQAAEQPQSANQPVQQAAPPPKATTSGSS